MRGREYERTAGMTIEGMAETPALPPALADRRPKTAGGVWIPAFAGMTNEGAGMTNWGREYEWAAGESAAGMAQWGGRDGG